MQKFKTRISHVLLVVLFAITAPAGKADEKPDPILLLQGMEAARYQIPGSELLIHFRTKTSFETQESKFNLFFDGIRRRCVEVQKAGNKAVFDGKDVILYDSNLNQAAYRNIDDQMPIFLADPRTFGINPFYFWGSQIDKLSHWKSERAKNVEILGLEKIDQHECWHVQVELTAPPGYKIHFWIADRENFRVYQHQENGTITTSFYGNSKIPSLPTLIKGISYNSDKKIRQETECEVISAKLAPEHDANAWSLAALEPPFGTSVIDVRQHQVLGYWDGSRVVANFPTHEKRPISGPRNVLIIILISLPVILIFVLRSKRKQS